MEKKLIFIYIFLFIILFPSKLENILKNKLNIIDISIIIPIFNSELFLSQCLNSIITQSLKRIEIICINDGSKDNSYKILNNFKNLDNRLKIINQKNKGAALARNYGINLSKGKFISFIDSDDLFPNKYTLELMYNKSIKEKALICGGGLKNFYFNNNIIKHTNYNNISFEQNKIIKFSDYQFDYFYQRFIYNRNFIRKNKLYFPNYLRYQDPPFFIKAMAIAKTFYALKNITYLKGSFHLYKKWNERKIIDTYRGINESLFICEKMNLNKLYCTTLNRINSQIILFQTKKYIKNKILREIISKILDKINLDIVKEQNFTFNKDIFYHKIK